MNLIKQILWNIRAIRNELIQFKIFRKWFGGYYYYLYTPETFNFRWSDEEDIIWRTTTKKREVYL